MLEGTLNSKTYDTLHRRLTVEEATASVSEGGGLQGITMKDSDEEEEGWDHAAPGKEEKEEDRDMFILYLSL